MTTQTPVSPSADYLRFCDGVRQVCGIDLGHYRPAQMERRLRTFAERAGHLDLDAYLADIRRSIVAREDFLDRMTINVSELFRNPERFAEHEKIHLPSLQGAGPRGLKVWSATFSYGAEAHLAFGSHRGTPVVGDLAFARHRGEGRLVSAVVAGSRDLNKG